MSDDPKEILSYYSRQFDVLKSYGFQSWLGIIWPVERDGEEIGFCTTFVDEAGKRYISFYVKKSHRGTRAFSYFMDNHWEMQGKLTFVTLHSCKLF